MNKNLKQLAYASGMESWGVGNDDNVSESVEMYGKLIVKEICGMMEQCTDDIFSMEPSERPLGYASQLQDWIERFEQHFGVNE